MNEKILVIDDDEELNSLLREYLGTHGYIVHTVADPESGLEHLDHELPDAVILDVMLPNMDGFSVCKEIRKSYTVPILMLTARGDVQDRIVGLELGADDYLPKPFEPRELVARLRSIVRRSNETVLSGQNERYGDLTINYAGRTVTLSGEVVTLTTNEFELLQLLIRNKGRVMERGQLVEHLRGIDWEASDRSIDMLISRIRQKLHENPRQPLFIKTITGTGYVFIHKSADS